MLTELIVCAYTTRGLPGDAPAADRSGRTPNDKGRDRMAPPLAGQPQLTVAAG